MNCCFTLDATIGDNCLKDKGMNESTKMLSSIRGSWLIEQRLIVATRTGSIIRSRSRRATLKTAQKHPKHNFNRLKRVFSTGSHPRL